ncbi:stress response protein NhaX-like isoform X3 [Mytilus californianus]|uniref:stress response protein NhaX-like isoform X3 n=1 Tax=Mytilus californianus TaxID=6549 RepID=UPI00224559B7|nr:stress response protein NhaX-like isoform X3 [Mytilus californianus]
MTEEAKTGGKNVVIAMDGSEHSKYAFKWFVDNCRKEDDHVYIVHAVEMNEMISSQQFSSPYSFDPDVLASILKKEKERVTQELQQYAALLTESGVDGTVKSVHTSNPGDGIVKCAAELNAAIIVTGTRGLGKIRRTLIGSTSDYILHHAHVPVMICRHPH